MTFRRAAGARNIVRMSVRILLAGLAAAVLACASDEGSVWKPPPTSNAPEQNVTVYFTDANVNPATARVLPGGSIVWINYAMSRNGSVFFSKKVRGSFTCQDLGPAFMKTGLGYQSVPIARETENVTLPCPLDPGEYPYEIWLYQAGGPGMGTPVSKIPAKIVVEGAPEESAPPAD